MGNCGGRSSYENIMDDFFSELNLTHLNDNEVQLLISNNINNIQLCENKIEIFNSNIKEYLKSFSENPSIRRKTETFWENSFLKFQNTNTQFYFVCCICFLSKFKISYLHRTIICLSKYFNFKLDENNFIIEKVQLYDLIWFYINFVTIHVLEFFNETENEKQEFFPTMLIIYKEKNRKKLIEEIFNKYGDTINLEKFFQSEMNQLHHINIKMKLHEIHLKSE